MPLTEQQLLQALPNARPVAGISLYALNRAMKWAGDRSAETGLGRRGNSSVADSTIEPLQDAIDIDEAAEAKVTALKAWKEYRVALNRLPEQAGYPTAIEWPVAPI